MLFPLLKAVINMLTPELEPSLKLVKSAKSQLDYTIDLSAWALRPLALATFLSLCQNIILKDSNARKNDSNARMLDVNAKVKD